MMTERDEGTGGPRLALVGDITSDGEALGSVVSVNSVGCTDGDPSHR
jgi:hypothetical protein